MDIEEDGSNLYNSKVVIADSVFDADTDFSSIPGLVEGKLPPRIKAICKKYGSVFSKSLTADKQTKFKPASLPLIKGAKTSRMREDAEKPCSTGKGQWTKC